MSDKIQYLNERNCRFNKTDGGFLSLTVDGKEYRRVDLIRAFPFTDPDRFISVRDKANGSEIGIIDDVNTFDADTVEMVKSQCEMRYFTPRITRVIDIKSKSGHATFNVKTDKGDCKFVIRMGGEGVVHLSDTRIIFTDVNGARYEVPDVRKYSKKEQKMLDLYV